MTMTIEMGIFTIPVIITVLTILTYYFGKLISDATPLREEKVASYIHGSIYLAVMVLLPLFFIISYLRFDMSSISAMAIGLFIQIVFVKFLGSKFTALDSVTRFNKVHQVIEVIKDIAKNIQKKVHLKPPQNGGSSLTERILFSPMKPVYGFIYNFIALFIAYNIVLDNQSLVLSYLSVLMTFFVISIIAFVINYKQPPKVTINLTSGATIVGRLNKIEPEYITLFDDKLITHINKSHILTIERVFKYPELKKLLSKKKKASK